MSVDGVDCPVDYDSSDALSITCTTGEADAASTLFASQPGPRGIKVRTVNPDVSLGWSTLTDGTYDADTTTELYANWEDDRDRIDNYGSIF